MLNDLQKQTQQSFSSSLASARKNNFDAVGFIVLAKCVSGYPHFLPSPHSPSLLYFILCGFCDKLKLSLHPTSDPPSPSRSPSGLLHVPAWQDTFFCCLWLLWLFNKFRHVSQYERTLPVCQSSRLAYQFQRWCRYANPICFYNIYSYVHWHSNSYSHINYFNCHMSFALYRQRLRLLCAKWANLRCNFCNEVKLVLQSVERNKTTCK